MLLPEIPKNPLSNITDLIKQNTAFSNPLAPIIGTATDTLTSVKTLVNSIGFNPVPPLLANPLFNPTVGASASDIITSTDLLLVTLGRFQSHTDNLSGVSLATGLTGSNFATISSIVANVQKYHESSAICDIVYGAFGAIMAAADIISKITTLMGQLANLLTIPSQIASALNSIRQLIESQIANDLLAFANAQLTALQNAAASAISSLINDACMGNIIAAVGTQELRTILNTKAQTIINKI